MAQPHPDGVMADGQAGGQFVEGGIRMFFDVGLKFFRVELAPCPPARFRGERAALGGGQIAVDGAPPQGKAAGGLNLGAARLQTFHNPFP